MSTYYCLLTETGQASLANAVALNEQVQLTEMAVGDGNGAQITPQPTMTGLVNEVHRSQLNSLRVDPSDAGHVIAEMVIPSTKGGWTVREFGVFDAAGNLFAIGRVPDSIKPAADDGAGAEMTIRMHMSVSAAESGKIELKIDPTVILSTRQHVADSIAAHALDAGAHGDFLGKTETAVNAGMLGGMSVNQFMRKNIRETSVGLDVKNSSTNTISLIKEDDTKYSGLAFKTGHFDNWLLYTNNDGSGDLSLQSREYRTNGAFKATIFTLDWETGVFQFGRTPLVGGTFNVYHQGNDGHNSGLDADMLDGLHASQFGALNQRGVWTKQQYTPLVILQDQPTIEWDLDQHPVALAILGGNRILALPQDFKEGAQYQLMVRQDEIGGRTLAFGAGFTWPDGQIPEIGMEPNQSTILTFLATWNNMFGVATRY
ncbi:MAG: phage tail protein [Desulfovibrio sp.]